jgi:hypothetical protein
MKKCLIALALLLACPLAHAAKVKVSWTAPTHNTDGSVLVNLSHFIVEWGTCNGTAFGTRQSAIQVPAGMNTTFIYPSGLSKVCIRAYAVNAVSVSSAPSNPTNKDLLPATGKPVTLGQPVVLPESKQE